MDILMPLNEDGMMKDLDTFNFGSRSYARDISESGQVVGYSLFPQ